MATVEGLRPTPRGETFGSRMLRSSLKLFGLAGAQQKEVSLGPFSEISTIALESVYIWFDERNKSPEQIREKYRKAATSLMDSLTPEVINDPEFYRLDGLVHYRILQLLSVIVPTDEKSQEEFIKNDPRHPLIASYLNILVSNNISSPYRLNTYYKLKITDRGPQRLEERRLNRERPWDLFPEPYLKKAITDISSPNSQPFEPQT